MSQVLSISSISIKKATLVPFGTRVCKILNLSFILSLLLYTTQEKKPFMRERDLAKSKDKVTNTLVKDMYYFVKCMHV
jgi:hypothetical protein